MEPVESPAGSRTSPRRSRPLLVAVLGVAVILFVVLVWTRLRPMPTRGCTAAGAVGTPVATSPDGAFDAWWAQRGPQDVAYWGAPREAPGSQPTRADFTRLSDTSWEWRYDDHQSVGVDVGPAPGAASAGSWAVIGVNRCGYG